MGSLALMDTPQNDPNQSVVKDETTTQPQEMPTVQSKAGKNYKLWGLLGLLAVVVVGAILILAGHNSEKTVQSSDTKTVKSNATTIPNAKNAFEELQILPYYNLQAQNNFQIPKNGIEYVNDIYDRSYTYPWLGTVSAVTDSSVIITKQYTMGDKVQPSSSSDTSDTIPLADINPYTKTSPISTQSIKAGQVFAVWPQKFLQHRIGDKTKPSEVTKYFALTTDGYSIDQLANSDPVNPQATAKGDYNKDILSVPSSLGLSNRCVNNAADTCSFQNAQGSPGTGLYPLNNTHGGVTYVTPGQTAKTAASNPSSIPFGEGVPDGQSQPADQLQRNVQGVIISVTASNVVIKTSSGVQWTLAYTAAQRQEFTKLTGKEIKVGSKLGGIVLANINDLDDHSIDNMHVNELSLL